MNNILLELEKEFEARNSNKYEVQIISNSILYNQEIKNQLLCFYYLVLWKVYPKKEYT